jgi:hypothetical protein
MDGMKDKRRFMRDHRCFVCGVVIPQGGAVYHAALGILACHGPCDGHVLATRRVYDRSLRGRWRPAGEVLAILRALRMRGLAG